MLSRLLPAHQLSVVVEHVALVRELVAMKLRAAELSNECDMLDHHATLVRRQVPR